MKRSQDIEAVKPFFKKTTTTTTTLWFV